MKKIYSHIFMLAALLMAGAAFVSCEKDVNPGEYTMTVKAMKGGNGSKALSEDGASLSATWTAGDEVQVYNGETLLGTLTAQSAGETTTLRGDLSGSINENDVLTLKFLSPDYSSQEGTLAYIASHCDYAVATVTVTAIDGSHHISTNAPASFQNQQAIFKFTLDGVSIDATHPLVIKDNTSNKTITTVTPASSASSVYVAMPAAASKAYKFVVITADNKYIKSGTATIEAGKYYQTTLTMSPRYPLALSSATAEWDLGAVACSDGNLYMEKKAAPAGKTAVGILGKVTETGHGLILALQDATSQTWYTINGWGTLPIFADTKLKLLPDDEARGSLPSCATLGSVLHFIGVSNWCVAQKSDYEAIFQNLGSTTVSYGYTYDDNVNAYITTGVGGTAMDGSYWSATEYEYDNLCAWFFWRNYWGGRTSGVKSNSFSVRPVLGF